MGDDLRFRPDRMIAPLMATAIVLLGGTASCIAIVLVFGEAKPVLVGIAIACALGFGLILWSLRDRPANQQRSLFAWVLQRRSPPEHVSYRLMVIRQKLRYGENQPPTLEKLREQQDATRTWVPSRSREPRSPSAEPGS